MEYVGHRKPFFIDLCASYYKYRCLGHSHGSFKTDRYICSGCGKMGIARYYDIASAGKRSVGQRLEGFASHDDCVSYGKSFEVAQVLANVEKLVAAFAYASAAVDCNDKMNIIHTDTSALMCGCGL